MGREAQGTSSVHGVGALQGVRSPELGQCLLRGREGGDRGWLLRGLPWEQLGAHCEGWWGQLVAVCWELSTRSCLLGGKLAASAVLNYSEINLSHRFI